MSHPDKNPPQEQQELQQADGQERGMVAQWRMRGTAAPRSPRLRLSIGNMGYRQGRCFVVD